MNVLNKYCTSNSKAYVAWIINFTLNRITESYKLQSGWHMPDNKYNGTIK